MRAREFVSRATGHRLVDGFEPEDFKCWYDPGPDYFRPLLATVFEADGWQPILTSGNGVWGGGAWKKMLAAAEKPREGIVRHLPGRAGRKNPPQPRRRHLRAPVAGAVTTPGFVMLLAGRISTQNLTRKSAHGRAVNSVVSSNKMLIPGFCCTANFITRSCRSFPRPARTGLNSPFSTTKSFA